MFLESSEIFSSELSTIPENVSLSPETDRFKEFLKQKFLLLSIIFGNVCEVVFTRDKSFLDPYQHEISVFQMLSILKYKFSCSKDKCAK